MRPRRPRQPVRVSARGFSLIELMLTVVILGVVAAIAMPRYANALAAYQADAAARRVVADIQRAQAHAKATSQSTLIGFSTTLNRVVIPSLTDIDNPSTFYASKIDEEPYLATLASADFDGDQYLIFDGFGRPDSTGFVVLRSRNHSHTITVDAETGEATIQ